LADRTLEEIATSIQSAAIRMLRRLREHDVEMGLGTARASVLSVLVFGGPTTITQLATTEQVRAPTMTRLVDRLEKADLARRTRSEADRRVVTVEATPQGRRLLEQGRSRRVRALASDLQRLSPTELRAIADAADALLRIEASRPPKLGQRARARTP
jgi:DNA-binding MarR family transcriptional regulator